MTAKEKAAECLKNARALWKGNNLPLTYAVGYGYSPATESVGMYVPRNSPEKQWLIFDTLSPMYGKAQEVTDWILLGMEAAPRK